MIVRIRIDDQPEVVIDATHLKMKYGSSLRDSSKPFTQGESENLEVTSVIMKLEGKVVNNGNG